MLYCSLGRVTSEYDYIPVRKTERKHEIHFQKKRLLTSYGKSGMMSVKKEAGIKGMDK